MRPKPVTGRNGLRNHFTVLGDVRQSILYKISLPVLVLVPVPVPVIASATTALLFYLHGRAHFLDGCVRRFRTRGRA